MHQQWGTDDRFSQLVGDFFFPARILDTTDCASCYEQNEAVKLSILLAAKFGHLEARMIAYTIFDNAYFSNGTKLKFKELRENIRDEIIDKAGSGNIKATELLLDPVLSFGDSAYINHHCECVEAYIARDATLQTISARTLLRLGNAYWKVRNYAKANDYYEKAALKGSKRAFVEIINGLIFREDITSQIKQTEIQRIFNLFADKLGGYEYLVHAQYFQFGLYDIIDRNLKTANQFYKKAVSDNCAQACIDYGDFLIATTQAFPQDREKIKRFYKLAVESYEKGGKLGKTHGYIKTAETLRHCMRNDFFVSIDIPDAGARIASSYQKILLASIDPLLMEKTREENVFTDDNFDVLHQHQLMLQNFVTQNYQLAFSINLEEID